MSDTMIDASAARFSNLDLDDRHVDGVTVPPSPVVVVAPPVAVVRGSTVSVTGAARCVEDEAAARSAGFSPKPPIYTIGTMVIDAGVANAKASRQEFEALPFTDLACQKLADQVKAEKRTDHLIDVKDLRMLDDGTLQTPWNGALPMTERAFEGLCTFTTPGGGGYLHECDADLRATNLNRWFPKASKLDKRAWNRAAKDAQALGNPAPSKDGFDVTRKVTLREREMDGKRELFATLGPRYGENDIDKIALQIAAACPPQSRCEVTYDGYKARFNVIMHSNIPAAEYVAGDIYKAAVILTTADDGSGSIATSAAIHRNLCLNLMIIDVNQILTGKRRHIGKTDKISLDVGANIATALEKVKYFTVRWADAVTENVVEKYATEGVTDVEDLFKRLVLNRVIHVAGLKADEMVSRLMRAFEKEPQRTTAGIVNAVTRMAHEENWEEWTTGEDLERTGGGLLFQKVWNVKLPDDESLFADLL